MVNSVKRLYEVKELLSVNGGPLPLSRAGAYKAVSKGDIPIVRIGRRVFIPYYYIEKLLMPPTESQSN